MDEEKKNLSTTDAALLIKIEEMIKVHISQVEQLDEDIQKRKDMVEDVFKNDPTYQEHDKIAKEGIRIRTKTKQEINKRSDVADLNSKLKEFKAQKSELEEGLSDYLREYQRLSGSNEIEGEDGQMREIIYTAKLIKKSSFRP